jgi:hypothetical protein
MHNMRVGDEGQSLGETRKDWMPAPSLLQNQAR